jgi:hypothetical protein
VKGGSRLKAIAVFPRKPGSVHLAELPAPALDQVPGGRGVLMRLVRKVYLEIAPVDGSGGA